MSEIALPIAGVPPGLALPGRLPSDERLARLVSAGSERGLTVLYERHHQALYRYCRSILRDHDDAQDALQSTMTRAFVALRSSERDLAVRPWLFRIAHNEAISILRKRRPNDCLVEECLPSDVGVERTLEQRERLRVLLADLKALPVRQRAALLMRELSGLPIEEIAAALSVSPGAAKQTLFEARSSLHELAEGRAMGCENVRRAICDKDGRVLRGRRISSHLRGCADCREFRALIDTRTADLRALAPPLPAAAATAMLARVLAHGTSGGYAGGAAATVGTGLGGHASASLIVKGLAGAAILAAASAGTLHLVRDPAKHTRTSAVASRVAMQSIGGAGDTGTAHVLTRPATVALTLRTRTLAAVRATHAHTGARRRAFASTGIRSDALRSDAPATWSGAPAGGEGKTGPHQVHGGAPDGSRGLREGWAAPRGPKRGGSHHPAKSTGPSSASQSHGRSHSEKPRGPAREGSGRGAGDGNSHTPPAHQTPAGQQPNGGAKGDMGHQPTTLPTTPVTNHGQGGK
jgi:RNA polymerase sigma factor (sigma-70 family)